MSTTAPLYRGLDQLTGEHRPPTAFFKALEAANQETADLELLRQALAAAVGEYTCPCGGAFEFPAGGNVDDYAALNRWLGHHGRCS